MNVCIFGSASMDLDNSYIEAGERIGEALALKDIPMVYGGGTNGMMGAAARGYKKGHGHIIGIVPEYFKNGRYEELFHDCDELIYTADITERIRLMEDMSDSFLVLPGGSGTYEELFHVLVAKSLDRHMKPLAIWNIHGYFDPLADLLEHGVEEHFISTGSMGNLRFFEEDQVPAMLEYLLSKPPLQ